jgi:hypothetical protein
MSHHIDWYIGHQNVLSRESKLIIYESPYLLIYIGHQKLKIYESPYCSIYCTLKYFIEWIKIKNLWVTIFIDILCIKMFCQGIKINNLWVTILIDILDIKMFCQGNQKLRIYESSYWLIYWTSKCSIKGIEINNLWVTILLDILYIKIFYRRDQN